MDEEALALNRLHTGRNEPPAKAFTEAAAIVGRRGGKSRMFATIAVFLGCFKGLHALPGAGRVCHGRGDRGGSSPSADHLPLRVRLAEKCPPYSRQWSLDESNEIITLSNRVVIEIGTASFRATRGYTYAAVLADEIAFWRSDESSANPDIEILRALRPGMASIPGALLIMGSSPYAKRGALYAAYRRHYGRDDARLLVWQAGTSAMNPRIDPAIIAEAYEDDPPRQPVPNTALSSEMILLICNPRDRRCCYCLAQARVTTAARRDLLGILRSVRRRLGLNDAGYRTTFVTAARACWTQ